VIAARTRDGERNPCARLGKQRERHVDRREVSTQRDRELGLRGDVRRVEATAGEHRVDRLVEECFEARDGRVFHRAGEEVHQRGRPSMRSATMVRWISDVPPPMVAARLAR
jgi:hypothetical protein